ncbi:MAG: hypothetical protein IJ111_02000 [Eggerthellaceae bacterium]|nr:hypothetical protein [Eggerthellaceae bacterium]
MITYKLSRREKALLAILAVVVLAIAWFILIFQNTTQQIDRLESEISTVESTIEIDTARVSQLAMMKQVIEERKAEGAQMTEVPTFDNMQPLMAELNGIMGVTDTYTLTFDELDRETSSEYVYRGVRIDFGCGSYGTAESVVAALANGTFPCVIDSVAITDSSARVGSSSRVGTSSSGSTVSAYIHVTFFEKYPSATPSTSESVEAASASESEASGASASSASSAASASSGASESAESAESDEASETTEEG